MYENAELIHLLDLCILSYQLHSQTLLWPMDPYYEQFSAAPRDIVDKKLRHTFMKHIYASAIQSNFAGCAGPGSLLGVTSSSTVLDPTICTYDLINPWRPSVTRPTAEKEGWILYDTPRQITDRIRAVEMARYDQTVTPPLTLTGTGKVPIRNATIRRGPIPGLPAPPPPPTQAARVGDKLYCFEGGTGAIVRNGIEPIWGMMGFVLVRQDGTARNEPYDVYIVFRGSRSGKLRLGKSGIREKGNADWVTDLDSGFGPDKVKLDETISERGKVAPGFAAALHTALPTIMDCLAAIQASKDRPPSTIYVTGHSLGAALATHFASAVRLGKTYRFDTPQTLMPAAVRTWPWRSLQLVTFALPAIGNVTFKSAFNLTLSSRTCQIAGDVVTQRARRYGVGLHMETELPTLSSEEAHDPLVIRRWFIKWLQRTGFALSNEVKDESRLPWRTHSNFKKVLADFKSDTRVANTTVSEILGQGFSTRLGQYLTLLHDIAPPDEKPQLSALATFSSGIGAFASQTRASRGLNNDPLWQGMRLAGSTDTFERAYERLDNLYGAWHAFAKFLGLCMFLAVASHDSVTRADNVGLKIAPFNVLTLE